MTYQPRTPQPYQGNPFGFVYGDALTANVEGAVNVHPISYDADGVTVAANVYTPAGYREDGSYAGIVVGHPNGAVKEQAAGLYAQRLAAEGFVTIAFDAVTTGESGGEPRNRDIPYLRVEDYRLAADVLSTFPGVDASRLAVLGICGGGGYALSAAQMDKRFKAVAVVSMFNTGSVRREGFIKSQADSVLKRLHDVADLRAREAQTGELVYSANMSDMDPEVGHKLPFDMYREGYEYYVETHAHPRSLSRFAQRDLMDLLPGIQMTSCISSTSRCSWWWGRRPTRPTCPRAPSRPRPEPMTRSSTRSRTPRTWTSTGGRAWWTTR